jgi:MFS transporter, Spinster family, sphingosine-1-phosphate transporter
MNAYVRLSEKEDSCLKQWPNTSREEISMQAQANINTVTIETPVNGTQKADFELPRWKVNFWFTILTLIYLLDYADRFILAMVLPAIKKEYALNDAATGMLGGILYFPIFLLAIPCGLLVDKWSRKYLISIMVTIWSIATWLTGKAATYSQLLTARFFVGAGEAGYNPAGYALIGAWFSEKERGRRVGLFNLGQTVSAFVGFGVAGYIAHYWGWRYVFGVFAVPGFILALMMCFAPDYKTEKVEAGGLKEVKPSVKEIFRYILSTRTLLLVFAVQFPLAFITTAQTVWLASFIGRTWNLNMAQVGQAMMILVALYCLGPWFGGWLSDKLAARNPSGRITAALICCVFPVVFYSICFGGGYYKISIYMALAGFSVAQFFVSAQWGSLVTAALDLVPIPYRGTCQSFLPMCQMFMGFFAPTLVGMLSDKMGLPLALFFSNVGLCLVAVFLLLFSYKSYNADYAKKSTVGSFKLV